LLARLKTRCPDGTSLSMALTKRFINTAVRVLSHLVPRAEPTCPQTRIVDAIFKRMYSAYGVEAGLNRFEDCNFKRILMFTHDLLVYLGENDDYYRTWLGFVLLSAEREIQIFERNLTYDGFTKAMNKQWTTRAWCRIPSALFECHKPDFVQLVLADYLPNLESHACERASGA